MKRPKIETVVAVCVIAQLVVSSFTWMLFAIGFEGKMPGTRIKELQAEVKEKQEYNDITLHYVKDLTETNTLMLCSIVPIKVSSVSIPCARLERERGLK